MIYHSVGIKDYQQDDTKQDEQKGFSAVWYKEVLCAMGQFIALGL